MHKYIESPEQLESLFEEYKRWVINNPFEVQDFTVKGVEIMRKKQRPLTFAGFNRFLYDKIGLVRLEDYQTNREGRYSDFVEVVSRIRCEIFADHTEGGLAGLYHHNLVARLHGLADKSDREEKKDVTVKIIREDPAKLIEDATDVQIIDNAKIELPSYERKG